jgi:RNA polymerase sigma-70 factor (ECF subfamily)
MDVPSAMLAEMSPLVKGSSPGDPAGDLAARVREAQDGDVRAFEAVYRACVGRVYALCLRLCGDAADAEGLTQNVFVRAWEKLDGYRAEAAFATWLHRLAVNVCLADRRGTMRRTNREQHIGEGRATSETPHGQVDASVDLERAIAELPPGARTVFVLFEVEGYSHEEIAELMGLTVGTSKGQLHRARALVRRALQTGGES